MTVAIVASALNDVARYFEELPDIALEAAVIAVNDGASDSVPAMRRKMEQQVNFPQGYLSRERLGVRQRAKKGEIEAIISGRDRPTSLARFVDRGLTPKTAKGRALTLRVKPGQTVNLVRSDGRPSAFLISLRNGNVGLAIRLKKGEQLEKSQKAVELAPNLYLLYGPSVDQVLKDVGDKEVPDIQSRISREFIRQFSRLSTSRG